MNYSEIAVEADYRVKTIMRHQQMLNSVRDYLRISFHEEHSMEQLCTRFATNEYILKLGFQMLFGSTVFTYLQRLRLAHAHKELKESQKSIKDIAHEAGYKHVHHFSSTFKKRYGITPVRLRSEEISNEY